MAPIEELMGNTDMGLGRFTKKKKLFSSNIHSYTVSLFLLKSLSYFTSQKSTFFPTFWLPQPYMDEVRLNANVFNIYQINIITFLNSLFQL